MAKKLGNIVIELNAEKAPKTVKNFLSYCEDDFLQELSFTELSKVL